MKYADVSQRGRHTRLRLLPLLFALFLVLSGCVEARTNATQSWSGVAAGNGTAFVGTHDGRLVQLDATTGNARVAPFRAQQVGNAGPPAFYGTPTLANGLLYAGGYHGMVYAMRAVSMDGVRSFEVDGNPLTKGIAGSIIPAGASVIAGVAEDANAGRLYVLEAESLVETCRYPARGMPPIGQIWSTPLVVDGVIYVGTLDRRLHAVRVEGCSTIWPEPANLHGAVVAPPFSVGDKLYVGTFDRLFYEVDKATGAAVELFRAENWFWGGVASDGQRLFVPNLDGRLYAYDLASRRVAWTYSPRDADREPMLATPAVHRGTVIVGSDSGMITVLRTADGGFEWDRRVAGGEIRGPLTVQGDTLYVQTVQGVVSAIDLVSKRLLWDRELRDLQ